MEQEMTVEAMAEAKKQQRQPQANVQPASNLDVQQRLKKRKKKPHPLPQFENAPIILEMLTYQQLVVEENIEDPLDWWKLNGDRFPCLSRLARRFLSIPASSAPSERVFSRMNIVIGKRRARLLPEKTEQLTLLDMNKNLLRAQASEPHICSFCQ